MRKDLERPLFSQLIRNVPQFSSGDTILVKFLVFDNNKQRIQNFKGLVISIKHRGINSSFTVIKFSYGVYVERLFPMYSNNIINIIVLRRAFVRRSKLYFIRRGSIKSLRFKELFKTK